MTEMLTNAPPTNKAYLEQLHSESVISDARFNREEFSLNLVDKGLVSTEFYESGAMDAFDLDEKTGRDALTHLLVGDARDGGHHLPSMMQLEADGIAVASKIKDPDNPSRGVAFFRRDQQVRNNGTYEALHVEVSDPRTGRTLKKLGGSSMFPNEWSTQDVLQAVVDVSKSPGQYDERRGSMQHQKKVHGVVIRAVTDKKTGKVITAHPVVGK